jgi:proliferating cell nuclear antigen
MELNGERGFVFETVQSIPFRTMTESLKEVLVDAMMKFTPRGVSLVAMDNTKSIIVQMLLFEKQIERYTCDGEYYIGINLSTFYKVIKTITTADSLMFTYAEKEPYVLQICINSIEKRSKNKYTMQLLSMSADDELTFGVDNFNTVLQMQSYYFQKTCKDLLNTGGVHVEIATNKDCIIFKSNDTLLQSELSLYETTEGLRFKKRDPEDRHISYGVFTLKHLITFTKCTTLCPVLTVYLMEGYPLVLQYNVATLGIIRYCIASLTEAEQ